jgi:hypothetical protein
MFILSFIKVCTCGSFSRLYPFKPDKRAPLPQINVDLLNFAELDEKVIERAQVVQFVGDVKNYNAEPLLFLNGKRNAWLRPEVATSTA